MFKVVEPNLKDL